MNETQLYKKIIAHLEKRFPGCKVIKIHGDAYTEVGTPDLMGCLPPDGRMIVIETKIDDNKPTKIQLHRLEQYRKAGAISFWCNSFTEYLNKLKESL